MSDQETVEQPAAPAPEEPATYQDTFEDGQLACAQTAMELMRRMGGRDPRNQLQTIMDLCKYLAGERADPPEVPKIVGALNVRGLGDPIRKSRDFDPRPGRPARGQHVIDDVAEKLKKERKGTTGVY